MKHVAIDMILICGEGADAGKTILDMRACRLETSCHGTM